MAKITWVRHGSGSARPEKGLFPIFLVRKAEFIEKGVFASS